VSTLAETDAGRRDELNLRPLPCEGNVLPANEALGFAMDPETCGLLRLEKALFVKRIQ
jgi:hypothetical protein